jgi:co-chaperonin GroES (HSP10)
MNTNPIKPCSNRVILKFFLGAFSETIEDGIIIPREAQESMQKSKPKYRWVEIEAVGAGCTEAEVGMEALVWEANVEFIAVKGEKPFNYVQEGQIMCLRDAQPAKTNSGVGASPGG